MVQDAYATQSFERGISAQNDGVFSWEIVPVWFLTCIDLKETIFWYNVHSDPLFLCLQVEISEGRGKSSTIVDKDEGLGKVNKVIRYPIYHSR